MGQIIPLSGHHNTREQLGGEWHLVRGLAWEGREVVLGVFVPEGREPWQGTRWGSFHKETDAETYYLGSTYRSQEAAVQYLLEVRQDLDRHRFPNWDPYPTYDKHTAYAIF
jgi:hypothetical protein